MNANSGSKDETEEELAVEILTNTQTFLKGGWTSLTANEVMIDKISDGYCNRVYRVQRPNGDAEDRSPQQVLYRKYGGRQLSGLIRDRGLGSSEAQETLVFYESGRTGRAPLIHGLFAGGRIEEFIEGHTIRYDELSDPSILHQAGEALAAFHALKLPLPDRTPLFFKEIEERMDQETIAKIRAELRKAHPDADLGFLDYEWDEPRAWILRTLKQIGSPVVFTHRDNNLLNFMVRDKVTDGQKKLLIIDYEMSRYGIRAFDLGSFFVNKTLKWNGLLSKESGSPFPTPEEQAAFLKGYADEVQRQPSYPSDPSRPDMNGMEQLTLEAEFGGVMVAALMSSGMRKAAVQIAAVESAFLSLSPHLKRLYEQLRADFGPRYPRFT